MGTALYMICAGVLLLFSSYSWADEPPVDGKTYLLSSEDSNLSRALALYAQGLYYLKENPTPAQVALVVGSFRSALALDPTSVDARLALVSVLVSTGDISGACDEQFMLARLFPTESKFWVMACELAVYEDQAGPPAEGAVTKVSVVWTEWHTAVLERKLSRLPEIYYVLGGMVRDQSEHPSEVLDFLCQGLVAYPESDMLMNSLAYTFAVEDRELPQALDLIDRALVREPENYAYLDTLGWVLYKMGDYEGAFRSLSNALLYAHEDHPELYDHIGDVLFKLGRGVESPSWWAKSYSLQPDPKVAEKLRAAGIDPEALP